KASVEQSANVREVLAKPDAVVDILIEGKNLFPVCWCLAFEVGDLVQVRPGRKVLDNVGGPDRARWMLAAPAKVAAARARARAKKLRKLCNDALRGPLDAFVNLLDETK